MPRSTLTAIGIATTIAFAPVLDARDAYPCQPPSAAEQKKRERDYVKSIRQAHEKEIAAIAEALPKATLSDADLAIVNKLHARGVRLHKAGDVSEADKVLRQALKMLGLSIQPRPILLRGC